MTRRRFLGGGAAALCAVDCRASPPVPARPKRRSLTPWIELTEDNRIVVLVDKCEMGQGVRDMFASIVGGELGVSPERIGVEEAPVGRPYRNRKLPGPLPLVLFQLTGGSSSTADAWDKLREGMASVRRQLVARATHRFGVTERELVIDDGTVRTTRRNRSATFVELLADGDMGAAPVSSSADANPPPQTPVDPRRPRIDAQAKVTGDARFGIDVGERELGAVPLVALVVRPQRRGDTVGLDNRAEIEATHGVEAVLTLDGGQGVAIVARTFWQAFKARRVVRERQERRGGPLPGSAEVMGRYRVAAGAPADGRSPASSAPAGQQQCSATYETPYGPHAPLEPMSAACVRKPDGTYHIHAATQFPDAARTRAARVLRVFDSSVVIHGMLAGGSFGRRAASDFIVEVAEICRKLDGRAVKLLWTREDDFRHDYLRPCAVSHVTATAGAGTIRSWDHAIVSESANLRMGREYAAATPLFGPILAGFSRDWRRPLRVRVDFLDSTIEEGITDTIYAITPRVRLPKAPDPGIVQVGYWRSVGRFHSVFAVESMVDELAAAAGIDPVTWRMGNLRGEVAGEPGARARMRWCIDAVSRSVESDRFRRDPDTRKDTGFGLACLWGWDSFAVLALEVRIAASGGKRDIAVPRAWAVVDCGRLICPDVVRQQVEGGIIFGLSAALKQEITTVDGVVQEANFNACDALRIHECPEIDVACRDQWEGPVPSPTGVGELFVPLPAPALANAIYNATGERLRKVPLVLPPERG